MGTSTNYAGSPNWGPSKGEATRAGGEGYVTPQKAASIVGSFVGQMARSPQLGFGPALSGTQGSGAAKTMGGGGSHAGASRGGGSARTIAMGIGGFLADVGKKGFHEALADRGLSDLNGKSPDEIALALADILGGPSSLIEQTALRNALLALVLDWSDGLASLQEFEKSMSSICTNIEVALHQFLGHYIFEVFKTVGYQGVLETHGFEKAESMTNQIRDFIDVKISGLVKSQSLSSVDWNGPSGAAVIDGIVQDTIRIFGEP